MEDGSYRPPSDYEDEFSLPEPFRSNWISALRKSHYNQGVGYLCQSDYHGNYSYCALGVACHVLGYENDEIDEQVRIQDTWFSTNKEMPRKLQDREEFAGIVMSMNDDELRTFEEIADWLETATYPSPSSVGDSNE